MCCVRGTVQTKIGLKDKENSLDNIEKITEAEFINKIQQFYAQFQARWGMSIQPHRLGLKPNTPRLEFMFSSVMTGQVAYIWLNTVTGVVGWSGVQAPDVV